MIQQINEQINKLDFSNETKPLRVNGNEKNIRQFYTVFFGEKYQGTDFPQKESLAHVMKELSFYLDRVFPLTPYFSDVQRITITMYVLSMRARMRKEEDYPTLAQDANMIQSLGLEEFVKKESGPHIQHILNMIASHVFMDTELRMEVGKELRSIFKNILTRFNYVPAQFQLYFLEIVFQYMLGLNLSVPYCILNDRLERFRKAKSDPFFDYFFAELTEQVTASNLPGKSEDHIKNLFYLFLIYFPDFKRAVFRRWKPIEIALYFDSNAVHVQKIKGEITELVTDSANITIVNPLEQYAAPIRPQKYDLIIGNIAASTSLQKTAKQKYLCTDYYLSAKVRRKIVHDVEEYIIEQVKKHFL